jgi:hypothetical protein
MKKLLVTLIALLIVPALVAFAQNIKEGVYQAKTANNEPFTVKIVKGRDDTSKISHVGYHFEASLSVGKVFLKSGTPWGEVVDKKLDFQFPVMLSFSPSTSLTRDSGGKLTIAYFKGEITPTKTGELSCVLTQIDALGKDYEGKFTMEDIDLASPPEKAKLEKKYTLTLKRIETRQ